MNDRQRHDVAFYVPRMTPLLARGPERPAGGAETQMFFVARALAARGLDVCAIVFGAPGLHIPAEVDGISIAVRPPYLARARFGKARETASTIQSVLAAKASVTVTRVAGPHVGLAGIASKAARRRFVYSSANIFEFDYARVERAQHNRILFGVGIRLADRIIVQTEEQVELCRRRFNREPILIKSIAETAPLRTATPEAFLWAGRLVSYKQPLRYLELARRVPEARFWMIPVVVSGDPAGHELLLQVEREARSLPNLELLEPRGRSAVSSLIERAVAVVNTSRYEGMPNVFLEAWARGVPTLSLAHDPDRTIEEHELGGFARDDVERFVTLARDLWRSRRAQKEVAARCRRYVAENHGAAAVGAKWAEAIGVR